MPKYKVKVYEIKESDITVEATTASEAVSKAWDIMSEQGTPIDGVSKVEKVKDD